MTVGELRAARFGSIGTVMPASCGSAVVAVSVPLVEFEVECVDRGRQAAGGATGTTIRDQSRSAGKRTHEIGSKRRLRVVAGKADSLRSSGPTAPGLS